MAALPASSGTSKLVNGSVTDTRYRAETRLAAELDEDIQYSPSGRYTILQLSLLLRRRRFWRIDQTAPFVADSSYPGITWLGMGTAGFQDPAGWSLSGLTSDLSLPWASTRERVIGFVVTVMQSILAAARLTAYRHAALWALTRLRVQHQGWPGGFRRFVGTSGDPGS